MQKIEKITVPSVWERFKKDYEGIVYYRTSFKVDNDYKDKKIIVYCRSGNRSGKATKILKENGFDAVNLIGGMNFWEGEIVSN